MCSYWPCTYSYCLPVKTSLTAPWSCSATQIKLASLACSLLTLTRKKWTQDKIQAGQAMLPHVWGSSIVLWFWFIAVLQVLLSLGLSIVISTFNFISAHNCLVSVSMLWVCNGRVQVGIVHHALPSAALGSPWLKFSGNKYYVAVCSTIKNNNNNDNK